MTTKKKAAIAAAAAAGGLLILYAYDYYRSSEDRPPIIVKGGSIIFSGTPEWAQRGIVWSGKDLTRREWKPKHSKGKPVAQFEVTVREAETGCGPFTGEQVLIQFGTDIDPLTFTVRRRRLHGAGKHEPKVRAPDAAGDPILLSVPGIPSTLTFGVDGRIRTLTVGNNTCSFQETEKPEISIRPLG